MNKMNEEHQRRDTNDTNSNRNENDVIKHENKDNKEIVAQNSTDNSSSDSGSDSESDSNSDSSSSSNKSRRSNASAASSLSHLSRRSVNSSRSSSSAAVKQSTASISDAEEEGYECDNAISFERPSSSFVRDLQAMEILGQEESKLGELKDCFNNSDELSDNTNENSVDDDSTSRKKGKFNRDLKEMIANFPDVYGVRRSARCRKEPERYTAEIESDGSDDKKSKHRLRRKDSDDWNGSDGTGTDNSEDDECESFNNARKTSKHLSKHSSKNKSKSRNRVKLASSSDDESASEDDDDQRGSRRTKKKVSYKEQSDHTDSDDLVEVDWSEYNAESESGECVEKVLEHRVGKKGATGEATTPYNVEFNGDPNSGEIGETETQYLIKWKNWSHLHNTWETEETLQNINAKGLKKIENYLRREEEVRLWKESASPEDIEYFDCQEEMAYQLRQQHMNVDRIIAHQPSKNTETCHPEYFCKFQGLPYSECTWEEGSIINKKFSKKIEEYYTRQKSQKIPTKHCRALKNRPKFVPLKSQPKYVGGVDNLQLRDYQIDGLNWLINSWCRENCVILADEMGLGKTIQTISFLAYLFEQHGLFGPFLLVVPLSTMASWQKEFEQWAPQLNVVVYIGDVHSRNMIRSYEWCHPGNKRLKFNVLLTTYEILLKDKAFLGGVSWAVLGIDEAHRLKNDDSLLYKTLIEFDTNHRILITGTPLQNSLRELWALLHFIMPQKISSWEDFENEHGDSDAKGYSKLHKQLEPFLIRRVKKDVEKSLPAKVEQILRVEMTSVQKQYYKWILTKNYKALTKGVKGSINGFANIMMELKKCCNHATLIRPTDELNHLDSLTRIIRGAGKLVLLDKLLCRLRETGHRVLIFSQMVRMLDIISDYLTLRRFPFQRLDGSIKGELRKQALDHFNAEGSQDFCFLLSTRAGGLGINLATADTVIIFDSDWNPQNDLQAQARAHRIGQKNQVNIYRLVTKGSVEEDIIERAKRKMVLDHLVIQRMDTTGRTVLSKGLTTSSNSNTSNSIPFNKEELAQILKFGAEELFKEEIGDEEPQVDIDEILKRAETREEASASANDELLSAFKVASFNFNEEDVTNMSLDIHKKEEEEKQDKDWDDIIPESERKKFEQEAKQKEEMEMFLPPRSRKLAQQSAAHSDSGEEYDPSKAKEKGDGSDESDNDRPKRRGRPKASGKDVIKGFTEAEFRRFIKSFKKFPSPLKRLESIAIDAELQDKPASELKKVAEMLQLKCETALNEYQQKQSQDNSTEDHAVKKRDRGPNFKMSGVTIFPRNLISCQQELEPLETLLPSSSEERKKWVFKAKVKDVKDWDVDWTIEDDSRLLAGVFEYGFGSWEAIKMDPSYMLSEKILPDGNQKPQAKNLQTRVEYLLKMMHRVIEAQKLQEEVSKPRKKRLSKVKNADSIDNCDNDGESKARKVKGSSKELKEENEMKKKKAKKDSKAKKKDKEKVGKKKEKKKKKQKRDMNAPAMHFTASAEPQIIDVVGDLEPKIFVECKEKMRAVKKQLKQLGNPDTNLTESEKLRLMKECLLKIGQRIKECLDEYKDDVDVSKEWRNHLWTFVSKFTEFSPKKLYKLYKHALRKHDDGSNESDNHRHHRRRRRSPHKHEKYSSEEPLSNQSTIHSQFKRPSKNAESSNKRPRDEYGRVPPLPPGPFDAPPINYMYSQQPPIASPARSPWGRGEREPHFEMNDRSERYRPYSRPGGSSPDKKFRDDRSRFRSGRPPPGCFPHQPKMSPLQYMQWPNYPSSQMGPSPAPNAPITSHPMPHPNYPHHLYNSTREAITRDPRDNRFDWGGTRPDGYYRNAFPNEEKTSR